ncbi:hypothetical protein LTR84_013103 [Exophiala bonariae]|uniref:Xylanolytic transcriptional activator regulatory domain-containing protein n=1 Tax=Exophiala bonariae TaxID=1690606 RepID=A0AAV9NE21_9EURO|nr:hypothetical protein LTR84_013103 [Exophiala bonariae]
MSRSPESENVLRSSSQDPSWLNQPTDDPHLPTGEMELPHFIKPLPTHLTSEDMDYLRHKGIFDIPGMQSCTDLLHSYVKFVHPLLPLLDLETFLGPMVEVGHPAKISLLLLYAVMCSGAAHVHLDALYKLGYSSRKSARRAFFERARLLYDLDCEPDRLSLVQAFLLMTYWYDSSIRGRYKDRKFWIRESVTLAQDLGLDLELENCVTQRQRVMKRIWWCCFMRDQFVALMTWTPPHFRAGSHIIPMLVLDDFEIEDYSKAVSNTFNEWAFINDERTRIQLAMLCIEKAKLSLCIDQILRVRYISMRHESKTQTLSILVPKRDTNDDFEVIEHDHQLRRWYQAISTSGNFDLKDSTTFGTIKASDTLTIQRVHLKLLFLSALIALHRPQVGDNSRARSGLFQDLSRTKLRETADEVGHLAMCMKELHLGTHIKPNGVTLFLPILLVHLQDIIPDMDNRQGNRIGKYYHCMEILDSLGDQNVPDNLLPMELEVAFRMLNILPSLEASIPPTISSPLHGQELLVPEGSTIPRLFDLGTMTSAEMSLLNDLCQHHQTQL